MKKLLLATLVIGVFVVGPISQANAIGPVSLDCGDIVSAVEATMPAHTLIKSIDTAFSHSYPIGGGGTLLVEGTLKQWVYKDNVDGHLIFAYQVFNSGTSDTSLSRITTSAFAGYTTDVAYQTSSVAPATFERSAHPGFTVSFVFPSVSGLPPTHTSAVMWIKTDAYNYGPGNTAVINGSGLNVFTYGPSSGTPEPSSMLLLGFGLLGLGGGLFRKRFKA